MSAPVQTAPGTPGGPAPLQPAQRVILVVGGVLTLALIAYGTLYAVTLMGLTTEQRNTVLEPGGQRLILRTGSGDVEVRPSPDQRVHVTTRARYGLRAPRLRAQVSADEVVLEAGCGFLAFVCHVDYVVEVPPSFEVDTHTGSGDVVARDLTGPGRYASSSGQLTVAGMSGPLFLHTSSGDVQAHALRGGRVDAATSSGDVRLDFAAPPDRVAARSSAGDVLVQVPSGAAYRVDATTGAGDERILVPTDPASARRITVRTSAGDVRVMVAKRR